MYAVGDVASGVLYDGYSFRDQAISELTAFGSAVRPLMVTVILTHALLVTAFGVGIWRSADHRSLRLVGVFMVGAGLIGFPVTTAIVVVAAIDGFEEVAARRGEPETVDGRGATWFTCGGPAEAVGGNPWHTPNRPTPAPHRRPLLKGSRDTPGPGELAFATGFRPREERDHGQEQH